MKIIIYHCKVFQTFSWLDYNLNNFNYLSLQQKIFTDTLTEIHIVRCQFINHVVKH